VNDNRVDYSRITSDKCTIRTTHNCIFALVIVLLALCLLVAYLLQMLCLSGYYTWNSTGYVFNDPRNSIQKVNISQLSSLKTMGHF